MSRIEVTTLDDEHFGVAVTEGTTTTHHTVVLPWTAVDEIGVLDAVPATVVRETVAFLFDREPATALWPEFPVTEAADRFPDFYEELRTRLAA